MFNSHIKQQYDDDTTTQKHRQEAQVGDGFMFNTKISLYIFIYSGSLICILSFRVPIKKCHGFSQTKQRAI